MYRNNDVWQEVANARRDDALRYRQQEQRLKEAGVPRPSPRHGLVAAVGALLALAMAMVRKVLA